MLYTVGHDCAAVINWSVHIWTLHFSMQCNKKIRCIPICRYPVHLILICIHHMSVEFILTFRKQSQDNFEYSWQWCRLHFYLHLILLPHLSLPLFFFSLIIYSRNIYFFHLQMFNIFYHLFRELLTNSQSCSLRTAEYTLNSKSIHCQCFKNKTA